MKSPKHYYFHFDDKKRSVNIHRYDTPQPWINYLSNGKFHAFVSQAGGGFAWWHSPIVFRLSRYRQYNLPIDSPGFYVYIRHPDGTVWSPTFRPCETPLDSWQAKHQPGITTFVAEKDGVRAELQYFVAPDYDTLIWDLKLANTGGNGIDLDIFAYVEHSQLMWDRENKWGYYLKLMLKTWYDKESSAVNYLLHSDGPRDEESPLVFLGSTSPVESFSGSRNDFIGDYRFENNPIAVERGACGNEEIECGQPASAIHNRVRLNANQTRRVSFFLGVAPGALVNPSETQRIQTEVLNQLRKPGAIDRQLEKLNDWWNDHFSVYQCNIPDQAAMRHINTWNVVNSVNTGRHSRSVNTSAPGIRGIGFRDSCQDMLAIAYRSPQWATEMLEYLLTQQYRDGHVVHYAYPEEKAPPTTSVHSDDHLWLPLVAYAILSETGDMSLLERRIPYLGDDHVSQTGEGSIWEHLIACIEFTQANLGQHGLPLILASDWNDTIGRFNKHGEGQSVFAGQQYVLALRYLIEIAELAGKPETTWLKRCLSEQTNALLKNAWDGNWWRRGFDGDGMAIGSHDAPFGKLFLTPQSWAILSGVGTPAQWRAGMSSANQQLDTGIGLKILTPSFDSWQGENSARKGYGPGCGENGAIFCHANTWAIIAEALLGNADRAWKYFTQLIPANVMDEVGIERYRAEPYAWVSNIVGPENKHFGWANVEQITGTAPWMDIASTQYLLGLRPTLTGLLIDPCIPSDWKHFSVQRRYRNCDLNIEIRNPSGVSKGVQSIQLNGIDLPVQDQPLIKPSHLEGKTSAHIEVVMGNRELLICTKPGYSGSCNRL